MDEKVNNTNKYSCKLCKKYHSSQSSLCNHNKKFHNNENFKNVKNVKENVKENVKNVKSLTCELCNKIFNNRPAKSIHKKKCNNVQNNINELKEINKQKELDLKIKQEEIRLKQEEKEILKLKIKLEQSNKVDNITLKKLNKKLIERNNKIKNIYSNNTINNIQNNQIINNFQLIGFGKEEVIETLTKQDKNLIMNAKYGCLEKMIEIVHCGKYNQFKNIIVTNMKDNYMYKYDDSKGYFVLSTKNDVLNSLIDYRIYDLEVIYNDLLTNNKLDENTKDIVEKFINKINYSDSKFTDCDGKEHDNYKQYKINEIKILLFNNTDKINSDISLLLSTEEK